MKECYPLWQHGWNWRALCYAISQAVKCKYHMISPLTETQSTKQTSKQNITKDIEIENRPTVTRGEGIIEEKGEGFAGKSIKGLWTITRRVVGGVGGKGRKLYLNINKKCLQSK